MFLAAEGVRCRPHPRECLECYESSCEPRKLSSHEDLRKAAVYLAELHLSNPKKVLLFLNHRAPVDPIPNTTA